MKKVLWRVAFAVCLCLALCGTAYAEAPGILEANEDGSAKVRYFETPYAAECLPGNLTVTDWDGTEYTLDSIPGEYVALVCGRTNCGFTLGVFQTAYAAVQNGLDLKTAFLHGS